MNRSDKRYTVEKEFTGQPDPARCIKGRDGLQWVARFCGTFISGHATHSAAQQACTAHKAARQGDA